MKDNEKIEILNEIQYNTNVNSYQLSEMCVLLKKQNELLLSFIKHIDNKNK